MKQIFEQYAAYNYWANQKMIDSILPLPAEIVTRNVQSSFSSLQLTLLHMWNTESVWYQRIKLVENAQMPGNADNSITQITKGLMQQSLQWQTWVEKSSQAALKHEFIYRNFKNQQFKELVYQVLLHLFNHGTYHRGQLVTMLRQLGVTTLPATDFIIFTRGK